MTGWDKTQGLNVDGLSWFFRASYGFEGAFFRPRSSGFHSPASSRIRRTVFGLTRGTQLFALAISSARQCFPNRHADRATRAFLLNGLEDGHILSLALSSRTFPGPGIRRRRSDPSSSKTFRPTWAFRQASVTLPVASQVSNNNFRCWGVVGAKLGVFDSCSYLI